MKIDLKALARFEKTNTTNYISTTAVQDMLNTVLNYNETGATFPPNYLIAYTTLKDLKIIVEETEVKSIQQLNS